MKKQEELEILRVIDKKKESSQRELAKDLGFSLGKLNYCLNALKQKGFLKRVLWLQLKILTLKKGHFSE